MACPIHVDTTYINTNTFIYIYSRRIYIKSENLCVLYCVVTTVGCGLYLRKKLVKSVNLRFRDRILRFNAKMFQLLAKGL
jgi:hypothetical protein